MASNPAVALFLAPTSVSLVVDGSFDLTVTARDNKGNEVPVPPGTQVRCDNATVVAAMIMGSIVHVVGMAVGQASLRVTKGPMQSNVAVVAVRPAAVPVPASIVIR